MPTYLAQAHALGRGPAIQGAYFVQSTLPVVGAPPFPVGPCFLQMSLDLILIRSFHKNALSDNVTFDHLHLRWPSRLPLFIDVLPHQRAHFS